MVVQNTYGMGYFGVEKRLQAAGRAGERRTRETEHHRHPHHRPREHMFALDKPKGPCSRLGDRLKPGPYEPTAKALLPLRRRGFFIFPSPAKILQNENSNTPFSSLLLRIYAQKRIVFRLAETVLITVKNLHP